MTRAEAIEEAARAYAAAVEAFMSEPGAVTGGELDAARAHLFAALGAGTALAAVRGVSLSNRCPVADGDARIGRGGTHRWIAREGQRSEDRVCERCGAERNVTR